MNLLLRLVLTCLLHASLVMVGGWREKSYPNPVSYPRACGMSRPGWVCDPDGLLTQAQAQNIDSELKRIHALQGVCICRLCPSSLGVGVALMNRVDFTYERTKETYAEQKRFAISSFATELKIFKWRFLKGKCLNQAIILVTKDKEVSFDIGRDGGYYIGYGCSHKIEGVGQKYISAGNYYQGIMEMLALLRTSLLIKQCPREKTGPSNVDVIHVLIGVVVGVVVIIALCSIGAFICFKCRKNSRRSQGGATYHHQGTAHVVVGARPQQYHESSTGAPRYHQPTPSAPPQVHYSASPPEYHSVVKG